MADSTVDSVNSALNYGARQPAAPMGANRRPATTSPHNSASEDAIVGRFVRAWESADLGALVALLNG